MFRKITQAPLYSPETILLSYYRNLTIGMLLFVTAFATGCRWTGVTQNASGVQLFQQGRYAEALHQFETAKQTDPGNPDTYYNLASTYHRMGVTQKDAKLTEQAESLYNQCLDLSPNHVACHRGLAVLLVETNRSDKAFKLLKNWKESSPTVSDARVELAKLHQEFNQSTVAQQLLDEALQQDPSNANAWAARGRLRESTGDLAQARQNYAQSLAINSLQPDVYQKLAALDVRMGQQAMQNTISNTQNAIATAQQTIINGTSTPLPNGASGSASTQPTNIANGAGVGTATPTTTPSGGNLTSQAPATNPRY